MKSDRREENSFVFDCVIDIEEIMSTAVGQRKPDKVEKGKGIDLISFD